MPTLLDYVKQIPANERKEFIKSKFKEYKSGPDGCIKYIEECLNVPIIGRGYCPFQLWDIQKKMVHDIVEFLFDKEREVYVVLGSRQCGKTTLLLAISDWAMTMFENYPIVLIHADENRGAKTCGELRDLRDNKVSIMKRNTNKNQLTRQILDNGSKFMLQPTQKSKTKGSTDTGRSISAATLWIDEAGFVDLSKIEESIFPTTSTAFQFCKEGNIPHGIILTSTPNGRMGIGKRYFEFWKQAESGDEIVTGFKLYWRDIPIKDDAWYKRECAKLGNNQRKINQEYELMFYGAESTFFEDTKIEQIQKRSNEIANTIPSKYQIVTDDNIYYAEQYIPIKKDSNYLIGIDVSKSVGKDYNVIEIYDYDNDEQVFEFRNRSCGHNEFVKIVNNITNYILHSGGRCCLCIESNLGFALLSDLLSLNPMYKYLIYRDSIGPDNKTKKNTEKVDYYSCKYGIETTTITRSLILDCLIEYLNNNLDKIFSKHLLAEIESLEEKNGRIEGVPNDDTVFSSAFCWLTKTKGRKNIIISIFERCKELNGTMSSNSKDTFDNISFVDIPGEPILHNDRVFGLNTTPEKFEEQLDIDKIMQSQMPMNNIYEIKMDEDIGLQYNENRKTLKTYQQLYNHIKSSSSPRGFINSEVETIKDVFSPTSQGLYGAEDDSSDLIDLL